MGYRVRATGYGRGEAYQGFVVSFDLGGRERWDVLTCVRQRWVEGLRDQGFDLVVVVQAGNYNTQDLAFVGLGERLLTEYIFPAAGIRGAAFVRR